MSGQGALWRDERGKRPRTDLSRFYTGGCACGGGVPELRLRGRRRRRADRGALRAAGIEVWFDKSELRGGDLR